MRNSWELRAGSQLVKLAARDAVAPVRYRVWGAGGRHGARPTEVDIEIIDRCCLRCEMCDIWKHDGRGELATDRWLTFVGEMQEWLGTFRLTITGGEPFMKRGVWEFLEEVGSRGIPTAIVTNGFALGPDGPKRLASLGVTQVSLSIDSLIPERHDHIRGKAGALARTGRTLDEIARTPRKFLLATNTVIIDENLDELAAIAVQLAERSVERVFFQPVQGGFTDDNGSTWPYGSDVWPSSPERVNESLDAVIDARRRGIPIANTEVELNHMRDYLLLGSNWVRPWDCDVKYSTFHCDAYGNVRFCVPYAGNVGNIVDTPPRQIWESAVAEAEREVISACTKQCMLSCNRAYGMREKLHYGHQIASHWASS